MQKKERISNEEIIATLYVDLFMQLRNNTLTLAEYYDKQSKFLLESLYELRDNEPSKIFKKSHREWEQAVKQLEIKQETTFNLYLEQCQELEEIMNFTKLKN